MERGNIQILEGEGVSKSFGGLAALCHVDFNVDQGQVVGLIGPNGAGKTTLFNLISGALVPDAGEIRYKGKKITGSKPHQICREGIARTFQSVKVFANMPVQQNVLLGSLFGTPTGMSTADATREATGLLEFLGFIGSSSNTKDSINTINTSY